MLDNVSKVANELCKCKYYCKCGHSVTITNRFNNRICDWCGNMVFKNKKDEFMYRMKGKIKNDKSSSSSRKIN